MRAGMCKTVSWLLAIEGHKGQRGEARKRVDVSTGSCGTEEPSFGVAVSVVSLCRASWLPHRLLAPVGSIRYVGRSWRSGKTRFFFLSSRVPMATHAWENKRGGGGAEKGRVIFVSIFGCRNAGAEACGAGKVFEKCLTKTEKQKEATTATATGADGPGGGQRHIPRVSGAQVC